MKKIYFIIIIFIAFSGNQTFAKTTAPIKPKPVAAYKAATPEGYTPITWIKAPGIATFFKAPDNNGSIDFITRIYLPQNEIGFIASQNKPLDWGVADENFLPLSDVSEPTISQIDSTSSPSTDSNTTQTKSDNIFHNYAFTRMVAEATKKIAPSAQFIWNAPFFNVTNPISDLSFALKSTIGTTTLISSGSRPPSDMAQERRLIVLNNKTGSALIQNFDSAIFVSSSLGDQAFEGFAPTVAKNDNVGVATGRLFLGVSDNGKELVIYCSQQATVHEASNALLNAGISIDHQLQADGGGSAACGYNLPGQFFVEPTRTLPLLMGATTILYRGVATTKDTNVRSGPAPKNPIVAKLPKNTPVRVFEEKKGWLRIGDGQWVSKSLIKKSS